MSEHPIAARAGLIALCSLPLLVTAVALGRQHWSPVLDMAMTELRVRDVGGRHTPLIGLPGRIGTFPDQGSHPGPASFWILAVVYRLSGSSAWSLELGSIVVNAVAVGLLVWIGHRIAGVRGAVAMAVVAVVAVRGYGPSVLSHPWNPYFPLLLWLVVLVSAWAVMCGDRWMGVLAVALASVAAQTHVPYLTLGIAISALVVVVLLRSGGWRSRQLAVTVAVGAVLWLPPFVDQLVRDPGNIRMLIRHFTSTPEEPIGTAAGVRLFLRHLDIGGAAWSLVRHSDGFVEMSSRAGGSIVPGVVVLALFVASFVVARRLDRRDLVALHVVVAVALAMGLASMVRIFGKVWYYLTLWAWGTLVLMAVAIAWTAVAAVRARRTAVVESSRGRSAVLLVGLSIVPAGVLVASVVASAQVRIPEEALSNGLSGVVPATVDALEAGVGGAQGQDGTYLVFWQDAWSFGSQGYGLVNELERRGYHVGVHPTWRVPVTPHRVLSPDEVTVEVHLVTGTFIDEWRRRDGYVEVVAFDQRTADEVARFDELADRAVARLEEVGLGDVASQVTTNLFGASLDPRLPADVHGDLSEMLLLGEPVAVFIAPAGSTS